jgi:hypothetical protein
VTKTSNDIESTKEVAAGRIRMYVDAAIDELLLQGPLTSLDAIVYSSCGGDLQGLIAEAAIQSLCTALGQNPIDLLERSIKNSKKTIEGPTHDA